MALERCRAVTAVIDLLHPRGEVVTHPLSSAGSMLIKTVSYRRYLEKTACAATLHDRNRTST